METRIFEYESLWRLVFLNTSLPTNTSLQRVVLEGGVLVRVSLESGILKRVSLETRIFEYESPNKYESPGGLFGDWYTREGLFGD